jgi:hypothetical protein
MPLTRTKSLFLAGAMLVLTAVAAGLVLYRSWPRLVAVAYLCAKTKLSDQDNAAYANLTGTTPEQFARAFFEACARADWAQANAFCQSPLNEQCKRAWAGLQVIHLGSPFRAGFRFSPGEVYPGVFVPYRIRLNNGTCQEFQLAIRCDNPARRWFFDGGL